VEGDALDVAAERQEVPVVLDREGFEAALVQVAGPGGVPVGVPPPVIVSRRMKIDRSPSSRGQRTRWTWLGMTQ